MVLDTLPGVSGQSVQTTTARREWWGWLGAIVWFFFMMYGYNIYAMSASFGEEGGHYPAIYMLVFAVAIAVFGWRYGNDPDGIARIASFVTPIAIVLSGVFVLLPVSLGSLLYVVSPLFMAPALVRRSYGVIHTAGKKTADAIYVRRCPVRPSFYILDYH